MRAVEFRAATLAGAQYFDPDVGFNRAINGGKGKNGEGFLLSAVGELRSGDEQDALGAGS